MRFLTYERESKNGLGVMNDPGDKVVDLNKLNLSRRFQDMNDLIGSLTDEDLDVIERSLNTEDSTTYDISEIKVLSPIKKTVHDIICVGLNYKKHYEEIKKDFAPKYEEAKTQTIYFSKRATETIGPEDEVDSHSAVDKDIDYEAELAVVIGRKGKNIACDKANDYIFGYTILNDISARSLQKNHTQWYLGKSVDTFTVLGPAILHKSRVTVPVELNIKSRVNGEVRQSSNTSQLLKNIPELISEISRAITLEPGDIIATGTPEGVGMGFDPPRYMKSGDIVECEIENIGKLKNYIV